MLYMSRKKCSLFNLKTNSCRRAQKDVGRIDLQVTYKADFITVLRMQCKRTSGARQSKDGSTVHTGIARCGWQPVLKKNMYMTPSTGTSNVRLSYVRLSYVALAII